MNMQTELHAAEAILQRGQKVKARAPLLFRLIGIKRITLTLRMPFAGTLHRVAAYYLKTGITVAQLEDVAAEEALELMVKHGDNIRKAVACALLNGYWSGLLFTRPLAWYLKWGLHDKTIFRILNLLIAFGGLADFMNTTRYIRGMMITAPNLGQKKTKGS